MISLYGCGFVGGEFQRLYNEEVEVIPRDERKPKSKDILYMISTTHNYHVHDRITLDVDTNLKILCDVLVTRNKYPLAVSASKTLLRERRKSPEENDMTGLFYQDLQRSGKCHALANKPRKAKSYFIYWFYRNT